MLISGNSEATACPILAFWAISCCSAHGRPGGTDNPRRNIEHAVDVKVKTPGNQIVGCRFQFYRQTPGQHTGQNRQRIGGSRDLLLQCRNQALSGFHRIVGLIEGYVVSQTGTIFFGNQSGNVALQL